MPSDVKAKITYLELLREDLVIIRIVPEDGIIPEYTTGQFLTIGMNILQKITNLLEEHIL